MIKEIWKSIINYEGLYEISDLGRIRSIPRLVSNHTGMILTKDRFLKFQKNQKGYPVAYLSKDGTDKYFTIHRLLAIHFIPNPENKPEVNHKDGIKSNYDLSNLEWSTASENSLHAVRTGLRKVPCGERNTASVLTEIEVREIYRLYHIEKHNYTRISKLFSVSDITIGNIIKRKSWKHLNFEFNEN